MPRILDRNVEMEMCSRFTTDFGVGVEATVIKICLIGADVELIVLSVLHIGLVSNH